MTVYMIASIFVHQKMLLQMLDSQEELLLELLLIIGLEITNSLSPPASVDR